MSLRYHCDLCDRAIRSDEKFFEIGFTVSLRAPLDAPRDPIRQGNDLTFCLACSRVQMPQTIKEHVAGAVLSVETTESRRIP